MNNRPDRRYDRREGDIDALALDHPFGELTGGQQELVLARLGSEEAYGRLRSLLLMTRRELLDESPTIEPRPEIRSSLHAVLETRRNRVAAPRFTLRDLLGYRVPAYTSVAGFATALVLAVLLGQSNPAQQPVVRERIVYLPAGETRLVEVDREEIVRRVTDSLKAELARQSESRPLLRAAAEPTNRTRNRNRSSSASRHSPDSAPSRMPTPAPSDNQFVGLANLPQLDLQKRGKNLAEDSSFRQFGWSAARDSF